MSDVKLKPDTEWVFAVGNETFDGSLHARPKFELVRCEDCKYYQSGIDINGKPFTRCNGTTKEGRILRGYGKTEPDWFCKDGERRSK